MPLLFCWALLFFPLQLHSEGNYKFQDGTKVELTGVAHLDTAIKYLHVREKTNRNDGKEVEMFLRSVGLGKGYAWCAAFVSYCLKVTNNTVCKIRSARALAYMTNKSIDIEDFLRNKMQAKAGDILVMKNGSGPYGHVCFIYIQNGIKFYNIEGNTNGAKSREGNGVYPVIRKYAPFAQLHIVGVTRT